MIFIYANIDTCFSIRERRLEKREKIVAIGHPNGDKNKKSYGIITSNIKTRLIKNKSNGKINSKIIIAIIT